MVDEGENKTDDAQSNSAVTLEGRTHSMEIVNLKAYSCLRPSVLIVIESVPWQDSVC